MRTARRRYRSCMILWCGYALGAFSLYAAAPALGQSTPPDPAAAPAAAGQGGGGLDMDFDPNASVSAAPATSRDDVQDALSPGVDTTTQHRTTSAPNLPPADGLGVATPGLTAPGSASTGVSPPALAGQPAVSEPLSLEHPTVVDTATFESGGTVVALFGIEGVKGEMADGMQGFLSAHGNRVTCQAQSSADFVCLQPDGTDVAEVALINGAARAKPDAPGPYRDQEAAAQGARRGIWANLPPPPVAITHPVVLDTARLQADGQTYVLDGLIGLGPPFATQLQGYIVQHGDSLVCNPQGIAGHYICLLPDGTDVAKTALVNGAARVATEAPDSYRMQQADALSNHRGFWLNQSQEMVMASSVVATAPPCCAYVAGDDGADGITYVAGVPTAVVEGETVFITYGDDVGWGYYDHWHHWRGAPGHWRDHLEHFHPYGHGLRGYGHEGALHREPGMRAEAAMHGGMRPGEPGMRTAMAGRPAGMAHPFGPGGGFVHPGPSAGGFHPGGIPMGRAAPAMAHASAPARIGGGGGGGGKRH